MCSLSIFVIIEYVGGTFIKKKRIAKFAGYFQIVLAVIGFIEVLRRFFGEEKIPDFSIMIRISIFALIANGACLYILQKSKSKGEFPFLKDNTFPIRELIMKMCSFLINLGKRIINLCLKRQQKTLILQTLFQAFF